MRVSALLVAGALALGVSAVSTNAAPAVPDLGVTAGSANIVEAAFGCGRGFHPNHWGRCVPNRWSYNRGWNDRYYGGGYERPGEAERALDQGADAAEVSALATRDLEPVSDVHADAAYRRRVAAVLVRRAIEQARSGSA